jgi:hypothetical protein
MLVWTLFFRCCCERWVPTLHRPALSQQRPTAALQSVTRCSSVRMQVAGEPAYDTLRTKQQLGYSVHVGTRLTHGALGFCVTVASGTVVDPESPLKVSALTHGALAFAELSPQVLFQTWGGGWRLWDPRPHSPCMRAAPCAGFCKYDVVIYSY